MCLFPVRAQRQDEGRPKLDPEGDIQLPCGKCFECKGKRAWEWAQRAKHEISMHDENSFITLTYDDEHLPSYLIVKEEFQKFMKRLRKKIKKKVRYMVSHEYGSKTKRPHHHAIIFGYNPENQKHERNAPSGEKLFTSPELSKLWKHGYHSIGTANVKTAYYIASYSLKASQHDVTNPETGEIETVKDSMNTSKNPAIGKDYLLKYADQLVSSEEPLPRYYQKLLEKYRPDLLELYENNSQFNNNPRSSRQLHAKWIINKSQESTESEYRTAPDMKLADSLYLKHLKRNRDYYEKNKEITK